MVTIVPARCEHQSAVLALVPRLTEFGAPPWRDPVAIEATTTQQLRAWFAAGGEAEDAAVLVALSDDGEVVGFAHLETESDFFAGRKRGYVASVAAASDGRGIGGALLGAAEAWAAARGFDYVTLNVFAGNDGARAFYRRLGYREDSLKLYKEVG